MLPRFRWAVRLGLFTLAALPMMACQRVPLLAPSGSTLTLSTTATALALNETAPIIAQVIEPAGTPPHSGTHITFTTTLGTIKPAEAETDTSGRAVVLFDAGSSSGTATITAISGGSAVAKDGALKILVGTAAVGKIALNASPALVPAFGGSTTLSAQVYDINGNPLPAAPVTFSTTAGTLSAQLVITDKSGVAQSTLTTSAKASVTASVGAASGGSGGSGGGSGTTPTTPTGTASATITVDLAGSPTMQITPPTTLSAGLPGLFTIAVTAATTNGSPIKQVTINWGDGTPTQDLGGIVGSGTSSTSIAHTYQSTGAYAIKGTVTDGNGTVVNVSTSVTVNPTPLALTITPPATSPGAGLPAIFQIIVGTLPTGDLVRNVHIEWGDTKSQDLGTLSGTTTVSHVYATANTYTVTATLTDTAGNSITNSTSVTVIPVAQPTIIITPTVPTIHSAVMNVTFQIQITVPTGVTVTGATIDFGDGTSSNLGGATGTITVVHPYSVASGTPATITVSVTDSLGRTTQGQTSIVLP